jgi:hypothetical protein
VKSVLAVKEGLRTEYPASGPRTGGGEECQQEGEMPPGIESVFQDPDPDEFHPVKQG